MLQPWSYYKKEWKLIRICVTSVRHLTKVLYFASGNAYLTSGKNDIRHYSCLFPLCRLTAPLKKSHRTRLKFRRQEWRNIDKNKKGRHERSKPVGYTGFYLVTTFLRPAHSWCVCMLVCLAICVHVRAYLSVSVCLNLWACWYVTMNLFWCICLCVFQSVNECVCLGMHK